MRAELLSAVTSWLLTYWVHATVLLTAAALLSRLRIMSFAGRDLLWKCALVGPLFQSRSRPANDMMRSRDSSAAAASSTVACTQ